MTQPIRKTWRRTVLALAAFAAPLGAQSPAYVPQIERTQLADGVHLLTAGISGFSGNVNAVVVVNAHDVLVFDAGTRPLMAQGMLAEIRKVTDKPVRYIVNSHWHPDHWTGNQVFADAFPAAEFIATEQTKTFMLNMGTFFGVNTKSQLTRYETTYAKELATGKDDEGAVLTPEQLADEKAFVDRYRHYAKEMEGVRRIYPTLTYVDEFRIGRGDREIVLMSVTGNAEGTTVMYLPNEKILVTGDVVGYPTPYFTPPPSRHAASLRRLAQLDVDMIVPGHGPLLRDKSHMNLQAEFFEAAGTRVRAALRKGLMTVAEVQKDVSLEDFRARFTRDDAAVNARFTNLAKGIIRLAYLEARDTQEVQ